MRPGKCPAQPYPSSTLTRCFPKFFRKFSMIESHSLDESNAAAVPRHLIEHLLIKPRAQAFLSFLAIFLYLSQSIPFFETADLV